MTKEETKKFEEVLTKYGYKRITQCCAQMEDDYEYYRCFRDEDHEIMYQIFFCFWDWTKYKRDDIPDAVSVDVVIMPESCGENRGRRDLHLSTDWVTDLDRVEDAAAGFYEWIRKIGDIDSHD